MERLTDKNIVGKYFYPKCFEKCDGLGASSKCDNCEIMTSVCEKLGKYEDLEEQGRLIKLPCKVGDTIYGLHKAMVCELDTETIGISKMPSGEILYLIDGWELDKGDFGKTVFLTKSEAEAKLKELRGDNDGSME